MQTQTPMNRKSATRLLLVQWSRFQNVSVKLEGSTLFTGINGSGKSTILDAVTYLITGNTQFNKAAKDRDRTVLGYVRGDTKSNGTARYLRSGEVISYVAMEFDDPVAGAPLVVGVCIESPNETAKPASSWFILPETTLDQINFARREGNMLWITPKNELTVRGERLKGNAFLGRERGTEQVIRALGLRCGVSKYRGKLLKMMAFHPENNIDQFIQECVLEPGKIESLSELREQRQQFERLQDVYVRLSEGKSQLEVIEKRSQDYEKKKRTLHIRELLLSYQDLQVLEQEEKEVQSRKSVLEEQLKDLEKRQTELEEAQKTAQERLRIAENSAVFQDMKETMDSLQRQIDAAAVESRVWEQRLKELVALEQKITELGILLRRDLPLETEEQKALSQLSGTEMDTETKISVFQKYGEKVDQQDTLYEQKKIHLQDQIRAREKEMAEITEKIRKLEANCLVFPPEIERARKLIRQELKNQGIDTEVFIFAELVQEVVDPEWRRAVETFLGRKRFYLIVDGAYCGRAMRVLKEKKLYSANVVLTDKLPESEVKKGSAAEILKIPNVYARRYANSLLNGIHLCEDLDELHGYPKGGLTRDGMLAKSYAVSPMDLSGTELCLGEDAIRLQLEQTKEERRGKETLQRKDKDALARILDCRRQIVGIDWDPGHYEFSAAESLEKSKKTKRKLEADLQAIRDNPDFTAVLKEQEAAREQAKDANAAVTENSLKMGKCGNSIEGYSKELTGIRESIALKKRDYEEKCDLHLELKTPMLEEYEKLRKKKDGALKVLTQRSVDNSKSDVKECEKLLESAQLEYCRLSELDINQRGVGYIAFYREEYRNLAHVKIEEARQRLSEQAEKLESAFMNDFVAEIDESVRDAKREMEAINQELKQIPFGSDTYRFVMKERPDRSIFFRICRKLQDYMSSAEAYMNSGRDDEEMEHDIKEFMNIILSEEDEQEYTDYRRYFSYDMEIVSRQGDQEIVANLSKKQGSASNGEKQTPYFIILAASLLQCYPKNSCCARLAFIDEAFSALSRERIEQMVKYFEENDFQVFYAAPPEKISSIGAFIQSTVSLVCTGRYTNAVEGLVKE